MALCILTSAWRFNEIYNEDGWTQAEFLRDSSFRTERPSSGGRSVVRSIPAKFIISRGAFGVQVESGNPPPHNRRLYHSNCHCCCIPGGREASHCSISSGLRGSPSVRNLAPF